jgi:hypothetical protein
VSACDFSHDGIDFGLAAYAQQCVRGPNTGRCPEGTCAKNGDAIACDVRNCAASNCLTRMRSSATTGKSAPILINNSYSSCVNQSVTKLGVARARAEQWCSRQRIYQITPLQR